MSIKKTLLFLAALISVSDAWAACPAGQQPCVAQGNACMTVMACGTASATTLGGAVNTKYGTSDQANLNAALPIVSGSNAMKSVDGSQSFDGHMVCPTSDKFIEIALLPQAGGDFGLTIKQQTSLATSPPPTGFNVVTTVAQRISGACANGFISCDAGTWNNCAYYTWGVTAGTAVAVSTTVNSLGGCFCINDSCGYHLAVANYDQILSALGNGIAYTVGAATPGLTVTKAVISSPVADFYGSMSTQCSASGGSTSPSSLTAYSGNPSALTADAAGVNAGNNTTYAALDTFYTNKSGGLTTRTCNMTKTWNVATQSASLSKSNTASICITYGLSGGLIKRGGQEIYDVTLSSVLGVAGCPASASWVDNTFDLTTIVLPAGALTAATYLSSNLWFNSAAFAGCTALAPPAITTLGAMAGIYTCGIVAAHAGTYGYTGTLQYQWDSESYTATDGCKGHPADPGLDPNCTLKNEWEYDNTNNGVQTYSNGNPTMLHVLPTTSTITTALGTYTHSENWWSIKRDYVCTGTSAAVNTADMNKAVARSAVVTGGVAYNAGTGVGTYGDKLCDPSTGTCTTTAGNTFKIDPAMQGAAKACDAVCTVKVPVADTQAGAAGNATNYTVDSSGFMHLFRGCPDGVTCPWDSTKGEIVEAPCQCPSTVGQAAVVAQTMGNMGASLICSTGVPMCANGSAPVSGVCP